MEPRNRAFLRGAALVGLLVLLAALGAWMLQSNIPRRIVMATGPPQSQYHELVQRYAQILARDGVELVERVTGGSAENARLVADPKSGVDVAFMQGGIIKEPGNVVMLASLFYEPLWVFYREQDRIDQIDELRYKRIAIGTPDQGVRAFVEPLLAANNVTGFNSQLVPLGNLDALRALQEGKVDAVMLVSSVRSQATFQALHDTSLALMSFARADAYQRRFAHISKLTLPAGAVDLGLRIPREDVTLIATEAMLVSRDDIPAPIVNLLLGAAREIHAGHGFFENRHEFPTTDRVDIPVSLDADRHNRFGPSFLHRYLPFFLATYVERLVILLVPLLVLLVPLMNLLPQLLRWRMRSRIYRWYGELTLLERDVASRTGTPPTEEWLAALDRIEAGAARIRTPASYASEAYTLREHIALVRRNVLAKAQEKRHVELAAS